MDKLVNINSFRHLNGKITEKEFKKLKILCVFAKNSKIFVTEEDEVYGVGDNGFGCLGLGIYDDLITRPTLNRTLTHKRLTNIYFGFSHCIGLTRYGHCYSWGNNDFGQLGNGNTETCATPRFVEGLRNKRIVQVCCGNAHNIALTDTGRVYAWGRNHFGEVGDQTFIDSDWPTLIPFDSKIVSVSCGKSHSMALTDRGLVYVWGSNKFGQLGRPAVVDKNTGKSRPSNRPLLLNSLAVDVFTKVFCGPLHSLVLTSEGDVYGFGLNDFGQVGNGSDENQNIPVRVNGDIRFKDIGVSYMCHISTGLSVDNELYVWGLCRQDDSDKCVLTPERVIQEPTLPNTLFQIYANSAIFPITYKTIVVGDKELKALYSSKAQMSAIKSIPSNESECYESDVSSIASNRTIKVKKESKPTKSSSDSSCASNQSPNAKQNALLNSIFQSFNNPSNYDIRFRFDDQYIFGHKTILCIRSEKFWKTYEKVWDKENNEIRVEDYSYDSFLAFLQFLYTNSANIETESAADLFSLADNYNEEELKDNCRLFFVNNIDLTNVCQFYAKAVEKKLLELEKICIDFVAKYYRLICLTPEYEGMSDSFAKKMIITALNSISEPNAKPGSKRASVELDNEVVFTQSLIKS